MRGREHVSIGVGTAFLAAYGWQYAHHSGDLIATVPVLAGAAAGSLAPDLDHPASLGSLTIPATLVAYGGAFLVYRWYDRAHPSAMFGGLTASLGQQWVAAAWAAIAIGVALFLISWALGATFGHRGAVHSLAFGASATLLVLIGTLLLHGPLSVVLGFAWGWLAHLLADMTTPAGLSSLFWPAGLVTVADRPNRRIEPTAQAPYDSKSES